MRTRDVRDYSFVDWLYGSTALRPEEETPMFEALRSPEPEPEPAPVTLSA
jgi:salicylate hydroxylase